MSLTVAALERCDTSNRELEAKREKRIVTAFETEIAQGFLEAHPLEDRHAIRAREILERLAALPLTTLDALHLAIAIDIEAVALATADKLFAFAARHLRLRVEWFGEK